MFCKTLHVVILLNMYSCYASEKDVKAYPLAHKESQRQLAAAVYFLQAGRLVEGRMFYKDGKAVYETRSFTIEQIGAVDTSREAYFGVETRKRMQHPEDAK